MKARSHFVPALAQGRARAAYLTRLSSRITAMASIALDGNSNHFDDLLFSVKPHHGQQQVARWIQTDLNHHVHPRNSSRLQDRYSIRCAPHIIGVLKDALPWFQQTVENELNSANDNPIIDGITHGPQNESWFASQLIALLIWSFAIGCRKSVRSLGLYMTTWIKL